MAFNVLVLYQLVATLSRALRRGERVRRDLFENRWLWASLAAGLALQCAVLYVPALQRGFGTVGCPVRDWVVCLAVATSVLLARELAEGGIPGPGSPRLTRAPRMGEIRSVGQTTEGRCARIGVGIVGLGNAVKPHAAALQALADRATVVGGFSPSRAAPRTVRRDVRAAGGGLAGRAARGPEGRGGARPDAAAHAHRDRARRGPCRQGRAAGEAARRRLRHARRRWSTAIEGMGRTFGVVFQHRFREASIALRETLRGGALGELLSVSASIRWWRFGGVLRGTRARHDRPRRRRRAADPGDPYARPDARPRGPAAARLRARAARARCARSTPRTSRARPSSIVTARSA